MGKARLFDIIIRSKQLEMMIENIKAAALYPPKHVHSINQVSLNKNLVSD